MTPEEFESAFKAASNASELMALNLEINVQHQEAKDKLGRAKVDAAKDGRFLPVAQFNAMRQVVRESSVWLQRIQIKLTALREERRGQSKTFVDYFFRAAIEILPKALLEDINRRAKELSEQ